MAQKVSFIEYDGHPLRQYPRHSPTIPSLKTYKISKTKMGFF